MKVLSIKPALSHALVIFSLCAPIPVIAADFPTRPVSIVVGFAPGGTTDIIARLLSEDIAKSLGESVVVENKPGADSGIAAGYVSRSKPDGHTLFLATSSIVINYGVYKNPQYNPKKDFSAIGKIGYIPNVLIANPAVRPDDIRALADQSKSANYFYGSTGTNTWLAMERLKQITGLKAERIPLKGGAEAINLILSGEIQLVSTAVTTAAPHIAAGKVKAIMVSDLKRNDLMPGVPTAEEAGLKGFTDGSWFGLLAPAGTPPDVIKKIYAAVTQAVQNPKNQKKFKDIGLTVQEEGPEKFQATVISESDLWKKEANSLGVSAD